MNRYVLAVKMFKHPKEFQFYVSCVQIILEFSIEGILEEFEKNDIGNIEIV